MQKSNSQKAAEKIKPFLPRWTKAIWLPQNSRDKITIMDKEVVIVQSKRSEGRAKAERTVQQIKSYSKNHRVIEIPDTEGISVEAWTDTLPKPNDEKETLSHNDPGDGADSRIPCHPPGFGPEQAPEESGRISRRARFSDKLEKILQLCRVDPDHAGSPEDVFPSCGHREHREEPYGPRPAPVDTHGEVNRET